MHVRKARVDMVIFGGGIAGLWTRYALEDAGFSTVLLSTTDLGDGQTVLSQGILHSGVKYALSAQAAEASRQLLEAQPAWEAALAGRGSGPDLRKVRVLADRMHMWSMPGALSKLTAVIGSKLLRSGTKPLEKSEYPAAFAGAPKGLLLWEVNERAVDASTLMEHLAAASHGPLVRCEAGATVTLGASGAVVRGRDRAGETFEIQAEQVLFSAGLGNAGLLNSIGVDASAVCQIRPLQMLAATGATERIFGHCVQELSDKPRLTVTSSTGPGGAIVWYLGGGPAEAGAGRGVEAQFDAGRQELAACLPWLDHSKLSWRSISIDRAEGKTPDGKRPDGPVIRRFGRAVALWPTKLALAPVAARLVLDQIGDSGSRVQKSVDELHGLERPVAAVPPWARMGDAS